jgi:hypothetical protein
MPIQHLFKPALQPAVGAHHLHPSPEHQLAAFHHHRQLPPPGIWFQLAHWFNYKLHVADKSILVFVFSCL